MAMWHIYSTQMKGLMHIKHALLINPKSSASSTTATPKLVCKLNYRREQETVNTFIDLKNMYIGKRKKHNFSKTFFLRTKPSLNFPMGMVVKGSCIYQVVNVLYHLSKQTYNSPQNWPWSQIEEGIWAYTNMFIYIGDRLIYNVTMIL